jgi:hypothetical protein
VFFRPEDGHVRSGEPNVLVPMPRGHEKVDDGIFRRWVRRIAIDRHGTSTVRALGVGLCGRVQNHRDAEHIPRAVRPVGPIIGDHFVVGPDPGERPRHPDLAGFGMNQDRLADLERGQLLADGGSSQAEMPADLAERRWESIRHEVIVGEDAEVVGVGGQGRVVNRATCLSRLRSSTGRQCSSRH